MRDAVILERRGKLPSFQRVQIGDPNQLSEPVPKQGVHVQSNPASPNHMLAQGSRADAEDALCRRMGQASNNQLAETGTRATAISVQASSAEPMFQRAGFPRHFSMVLPRTGSFGVQYSRSVGGSAFCPAGHHTLSLPM